MKRRVCIRLIPVLLALLVAGGFIAYALHHQKQQRLDRALIEAIRRADTTAVLALLKEGADPNAEDRPEEPPQSFLDLLRSLFSPRRQPPRKYDRALALAARPLLFGKDGTEGTRRVDAAILRALLEHGADVNARDHDGYTALIWAAETGNEEIVFLLLEHGAEIHAKNDVGDTALSVALEPYFPSENRSPKRRADAEILQALLEHGADANTKDIVSGTPALTWAAQNDDTVVVRLLLERGADVNARNGRGETALMLAAARGDKDIVRLLLARRADANAKDGADYTALMLAARFAKTDIVRLLLDRGADINGKENELGGTALMWATEYGKTDTVRLLIARGADVNAKDVLGNTALKIAKQVSTQLVEILKRAGAKE